MLKGRVVRGMFLMLFLFNNICAFSQFEVDNANISIIKFYLPNLEYKKNKIKEVKTYFGMISKNPILVNYSIYDKEGFLVYKEIYNNASPKDKETIEIKKNEDVFVVKRTIDKKSLLNADSCFECFWQLWYYPFREYWGVDDNSTIEVESIYRLLNDFNLHYSTFVNGKKIDTGSSLYNFPIEESGLLINNKSSMIDTIFRGDTSVLYFREPLTRGSNIVKMDYFLKGLIIKSEEKNYLNDSLLSSSYTLYNYNENKQLYWIGYYDIRGKLRKKKIFNYIKTSKNYSITEEVYFTDGRLSNVSKYNSSGKVLEESTFGANEKVVRKTEYKYFSNGLLNEKYHSSDNSVKTRYSYSYTKF